MNNNNKPTKQQQNPWVTYNLMSHGDAPCCCAGAPQFGLRAPSAVLTFGLFQEASDTCF